MMGFGGYGGGGSYLSPSLSNLSASAPPFTIDRSQKPGSVPLVDLLEPSYSGPMNSSLNNWLPSGAATSETNFFANPNSELNSAPSPNNGYHYQGLQTAELSNSHTPHLSTIVSASTDPFSYGQSVDNVANPYYPSYLSPTSCKDGLSVTPDRTIYWSKFSRISDSMDGFSTDYSQRLLDSKCGEQWGGGLWNGFAEWKQGKQGNFDGSFSSKETDGSAPSVYENYMYPEAHFPKGLNRGGEVSHGVSILDMDKQCGSLNAEKLDGKAFLVKTSNFMPLDPSRSILGSISELSETRLESPAVAFGSSSENHHLAYGALSEQHMKQCANDGVSIMKSSPALVIGTPAFGSTSVSGNAPFKTVNSGSDASDKDRSSKTVSSIKESHSQLISDHKPAFDSSQLRIHLERDDPVSLGLFFNTNDETSNKESITDDTSRHVQNANSGLKLPNLSHDRFNIDLNVNETANSVQDPTEGVDHYNHAVDSPCWKGVPGTHSSSLDASEAVRNSKKVDTNMYNNLNVQAKQVREVSSQKPNENKTYNDVGYQEHGFELPSYKSPHVNLVSGEQKSDDATEAGYQSETKGVQHFGDNYDDGNSFIGFSDSKNMKGYMPCTSSHLPIHVESVEEASGTNLDNPNERSLTPTIDVLGLVNTMHNLSELLLFHCMRGSYQLKQKDLVAVQNVVNNLSVCMSKKAETMAPTKVLSSEKDTIKYLGELSSLHKGFNAERPQVTKTAGSIQALVDAQIYHERNKYFPGKEDGMLESLSVKGDVDITDEVKATQSLKKVLSENFSEEEETQPQTLLYKNLWLEAEAALCSATYKARYNRMKIEMEKLSKSKNALESTTPTDMKQPLSSELSPDSNEVVTSSPKDECYPAKQSQDSLSTSINDDDVMGRFQILRCRIENSNCSSAGNVDKPSSSSTVTPHSTNVASLLSEAHEQRASPGHEVSIKASSDSSTNKDINDFDASVMARFHILKSRADNCSTPSTEVPQLVEAYCDPPSTEMQPPVETYKPRFVSQRSNWPLIASISENPEQVLQHRGPETTEGQLETSRFHMSVSDDPVAQSHLANRTEDSMLAGWHDRMPSDWEHVRKEELGFHNR